MKIDKIKKQKVQHLVNNISEGFNISAGKFSFISFFITPLLAVKIFGYLKKQKRPQRDMNISMKA
jgi:hypothetical protein